MTVIRGGFWIVAAGGSWMVPGKVGQKPSPRKSQDENFARHTHGACDSLAKGMIRRSRIQEA